MASLTLKDIPPALHERLKQRAARNRRSLSQEALACLEAASAAEPIDTKGLLAQAERFRATVKRIRPGDIDAWKRMGRP